MDNRMLAQISMILRGLNTPLILLDADGNSLVPGDDIVYQLPSLYQNGVVIEQEGRMYLNCTAEPEWVLMTTVGDHALSRDTLTLCDAMISAFFEANAANNDVNNAYQRILQNELSLAELDAVVDEYHITQTLPRCVLLMHMVQVQQRTAYDILYEILPHSPCDVLVAMDKHTAAFIKDVSILEEDDDLYQFASAVQETLTSETALNVTIGIGDVARSVGDLHASFRQARRAIEIGRAFAEDRTVYVYRAMLLERLLSDLPADIAEHYHSLLFNRSTSRLFSEEMLYTIEMFFKKDLNLSDTARQLYIHRNTLVYRLDKVQRQIGLDLRKFEDAVTFKILLDMRKCINNRMKMKKSR